MTQNNAHIYLDTTGYYRHIWGTTFNNQLNWFMEFQTESQEK